MVDIALVSDASHRIANAITLLLRRGGLAQYELAEMVNMSRSALNRRMNGDGEFTADEMVRIARVLRVKPSELFNFPVDRGIPVLGTVPGGPINIHWQLWDTAEACEDWEDRKGHEHRMDAFAVRVVGDSMEPRIPEGARIVCYPIPRDAQHLNLEGRVVVVTLDEDHHAGETTLGVWRTRDDGITVLRKINAEHYDPIILDLDHVRMISTVEEVRYRP